MSFRSQLTFANVMSIIAVFVALGGTSIAAVSLSKNSVGAKQIKKNAVKAPEISRNAVGASEVRSNAIAGGDIADGGIGSLDIGDNAIGGGELADNSVGSSELGANSVGSDDVVDEALTAADIVGSTLDLEVGPDAFGRVGSTGTLEASTNPVAQNKNIAQANVQHPSVGTYCFGGLPFTVRSAQITLDSAMATTTSHKVPAVAVQRGLNLDGCDADHQQARVTILSWTEVAPPALSDHGFYIWFEG